MELMDQRLRVSVDDDPTAAVLAAAEQAGIGETVRRRYSTIAHAYISQRVHLDPARPPRMLMLQVNDGEGWEHRVSWGQYLAEWSGAPFTSARRLIGQLPKAGQWQELRLPLIWLGLHDRPICGMLFGQIGGQRTLWGRTGIVIDGKEHVLIADQTPQGVTSGFWEWIDAPAPGGKAHAYIAPVTDDEPAWHSVFSLKNPMTAHLLIRPAESVVDPVAAMAALEQGITALGDADVAIDYLRRLVAMELDASGKLQRCKWFLKMHPAHPRAPQVLGDVLELARATQQANSTGYVDGIIDECKIPLRTRYAYRRAFGYPQRQFLRDWQILGPFPNADHRGLDTTFAPEAERIRLDTNYRGMTDTIRWKLLKSRVEWIDLASNISPNQGAIAYALCWVYSEKGRPAMIEIGASDGSKLWLNHRLVHWSHQHEAAQRGQYRVPAYLMSGWNEVLLKIEQDTGDWGFFFELVDPEGRGPLLTDVKISTNPAQR